MTQVARWMVAVIAALAAAFLSAVLSWRYGLLWIHTDPGSPNRMALAVGVATVVGPVIGAVLVAIFAAWAPRPRTDKPKYSTTDLLEKYLRGVEEAACHWPTGWPGRPSLPDKPPAYQTLEVVDADPISETAHGSAEPRRRSWKDISDNRLIILFGDAGQGKTWTLQNEARSMAADAVRALHARVATADLELPLYARAPDLSKYNDTPNPVAALIHRSVNWACKGERASDRQQIVAALDQFVSNGGKVRPLVDAMDEVPTKESTRVWEIIRTCIKNRRAVIASRRAGFELLVDDFDDRRDGCFMLLPLEASNIRKFVLSWYGEDRASAVELYGQLMRSELLRIACVPLFLAMLCDLHAMRKELPETTTKILENMCRRILQADWRHDRRHAVTIDRYMELSARLAWYFSTEQKEWRDQIEVDEAVKAILAICANDESLPQPNPTNPRETGALAMLTDSLGGLLSITPSADTTSPGSIRFTHRTLHEFLTALYMAKHAEEEGMKYATRVWWIDPDWIDVIPHAVALSPTPGRWVNLIAGDRPDTLCTSTITALRGIALVAHDVSAPEFEELVTRSAGLLAHLQIVASASRVANRLRDAIDHLPIGRRSTLESREATMLGQADTGDFLFEVDEILDDIDEVLEENAEEYVRSYRDSTPRPFADVRIARNDERSELEAFVKREWLRIAPSGLGKDLPGPVSNDSPWSVPDVIQICMHGTESYGWWVREWLGTVFQAISHGEVAVTIPVLIGFNFVPAREYHEVLELGAYVLARERWIMTDALIRECSRTIGPMGRVAAARALQYCKSADSVKIIRELLSDPEKSVRDTALKAISCARHQSLIDLLAPLVIEDVPGIRRAVEHYLHEYGGSSDLTAMLMAMVKDHNVKVRETALAHLVRDAAVGGDELSVAKLIEDETNPQARAAAIWTLDPLKGKWTADLAEKGYISDKADVSRAAWADIAVAHASRLSTGRVLRQIASDQAIALITRLNAVKAMWRRGMASDVLDVAVVATSYGQEQDSSRSHIRLLERNGLPWHLTDSNIVHPSDVELLCVLLERARVRDPFTHPVWHAADELLPSLGVIFRDLELRIRFRMALDHFEHYTIVDP